MRLLIFTLLILFAFTAAKMEAGDLIVDSYTLRQGDRAECPRAIRFNNDTLTFEFNYTEFDDVDYDDGSSECKSKSLFQLKTVGASFDTSGSSTAVKYFKGKITEVEEFLVGSLTETHECRKYKFPTSETWIFLKPDEDFDAKWSEVFGKAPKFTSDGSINEASSYELDDNERYIIVGERCFYEDTSLTDRVCFPSSATAQLQDGSLKTMDQLSIGDRVHVGNGMYSPIFAWTHQHANVKHSFVKLTTESGHTISATRGHYIRANDKLMTMKSVKVGMTLRTADGHLTTVVGKELVQRTGLYNPQTAHGDIAVDGIVATTYTSAVEPKAAHALLTPVRAAFSLARSLVATESVEL